MKYYLSYGGGVNSTALAMLAIDGKLPGIDPADVVLIFADTKTEKDETYYFIKYHFVPMLALYQQQLITVQGKEGVLETWERLSVTGSRTLRSCTVEKKVTPIKKYMQAHEPGPKMIGFSSEESHRAKRVDSLYPLIELGIDRQGCEKTIADYGLPVPVKSGCWCCPFTRVGDILNLIRRQPERAERILNLEHAANAKHGHDKNGNPRNQFHDRPMEYWIARAAKPEQCSLWEENLGADQNCFCRR